MFYSQKDLLEVISCSCCHQIYTDPRVLACQHTFCLRCLQDRYKNNGVLTCPTCNAEHTLASATTASANDEVGPSQLPCNITIQKLIDIQPSQLYRGELVKELTEKLNELDERFNTQSHLVQNAPTVVTDYCGKLRAKIKSQAEKIKSKVDEFQAQFEEQIDLFESECVVKLNEPGMRADKDNSSAAGSESVVDSASFNNMANEFKVVSQEARAYLSQFDLDKSKLEKMLDMLNQYSSQVDEFGVKFQASIFKNTRLDFKPNPESEEIKPSFLGEICAITSSKDQTSSGQEESVTETTTMVTDQQQQQLESGGGNEEQSACSNSAASGGDQSMVYESVDETAIETIKEASFNIDLSKMRCFKLNKVCVNYHSGFTLMRLDDSKFLLFYINNENRLEVVKFDVQCNISYQNSNVLAQTRINSVRVFKSGGGSLIIYAEHMNSRVQSLTVLDLASLRVVKQLEIEAKLVNLACTRSRIYTLNKTFELTAYTLELDEVPVSKSLARVVPKTVVCMDAHHDLVYFMYYECKRELAGSYDLSYNMRIVQAKSGQILLDEPMSRHNQLKISSSPWCLFTYSSKHKSLTAIKLTPVYDTDKDTILLDEDGAVPTSIKIEHTKKYDVGFVKENDTVLVKDKLDGMFALYDRSTFKIYFSLC